MRTIKYLGLWLAAMVIVVLLTNLVGGLLCKTRAADVIMPSLTGYSKKMHLPLDEETANDSRKTGALLSVRSLLSDNRLTNDEGLAGHLFYAQMDIDTSVIFVSKDGLSDLSSGIFAAVYREDDDTESPSLVKTFALMDVRALYSQECAQTLMGTLRANPQADIRIDAYTIQDQLLQPLEMTVLGQDGSELLHVECTAEGERITADNCFVRQEGTDENGLYTKLLTASLGERESDKIAASLVAELPFDQATFQEDHTQHTFGKLKAQQIEVNDGYAMITAYVFDYSGDVILHIMVLGGIVSVIILILYIARRNKA
ncbi:MAG: hypothetical protein K5695_09085 [Oscillospiraceae bacterium]|nr:hypothetical protein [Oscillospiraceae bacterium]